MKRPSWTSYITLTSLRDALNLILLIVFYQINLKSQSRLFITLHLTLKMQIFAFENDKNSRFKRADLGESPRYDDSSC
jgi:hypothetical protein